jgi:hypothetical protein
VLVNVASYHLAYVAALLGALVMSQRRGDANALVTVTAVLFLLFSLGLSVTVLGPGGVVGDLALSGPSFWLSMFPGYWCARRVLVA